ncbi:transporter substrate-binding domain-containing protein [Streptomyces lydicus]|uniref:transporter substrate-binding domain-containing protein n=1 Tax=Streptomyces lydicus TaxID=47763 RepID=UPI00286FE4D9|nr:transporter substrate-binding domain-containing protein [Streptomyces lydicus]
MTTSTPRTTSLRAAALLATAALALTACGSGDPSDGTGPAAATARIPTTDVVSGVKKDPAAAKLLPAGVRALDFVTYVNDGQGFAAREDSPLRKVTSLRQLCGLTVATGAGTTFETTLEENAHLCKEAGKQPYDVKTYAEQGALWISLQQGRSDVVMSTINGLRYAVRQQPGLRFLNEFKRLDVGFAFKKGTPLAPAVRAAVNRLKKDGTYDRILKKWGTGPSAIATSRISPPEVK